MTKTADPASVPETGANVTFTFTVRNSGPVSVTLTALQDSVYGSLGGDADCQLATILEAGAACQFAITRPVAGDAGGPDHVNTFTAKAVDDDDNEVQDDDDASVSFIDVLPSLLVTKTAQQSVVTGISGDVTFDIVVTNNGPVSLTLTSLTDTDFGDLTILLGSTCVLPQEIAVGGSYSCAFTGTVTGSEAVPHQNTVTAKGEDDDGNKVEDEDDEAVTFDELPSIVVTKTVNPTQIVEPGGQATFTVIVTNTGPVTVTLTGLNDTDFGDLNGQGTCAVPQTNLAPNGVGSYICTFTKTLDVATENPHQNTVTATAKDKDDHETTADADAVVEFLPRGTIGDRVWFDLNENGVQDDGEPGIPGVSIDLLDSGGNVVASTTTDANGIYTFTNVIPGAYNVQFPTVGLTNQGQGGDPAKDTNPDTGTGKAPITLAPGETNVTTDAGYLPGKIIVHKETTVPSTQEFDFAVKDSEGITLTSGSFKLTNGGSMTFTVEPGSYSVTEATTDGWTLQYASCGDIRPQIAVANPFTQFLELGYGQTIECVFVNDPLPSVQVTKTANTSVVPGASGLVTFTVEVKNSGLETVTLTVLTDTVFGDLDGLGTCSLDPAVVLAPNAVYTCAFPGNVEGDEATPHMNTVKVIVFDDDEEETEDTDDETVTFDEKPGIQVTKTAGQQVVSGTSADVTFDIVVTNNGPVSLTLTSLTDSVFGDLTTLPGSTCVLPQTLAANDGSYSCAFTGTVTGDENTPHANTVTATGKDKDGNEVEDEDDETVTFDEKPGIQVTKTAGQQVISGTSGDITFDIVVTNNGPVALTLTSLTDSVFGDLTTLPGSTCVLPQTLAANDGSYSCAFTGTVTGDENTPHANTVTASGKDKDGNEVTDEDDETVTFDEEPGIQVSKTAGQQVLVGTTGTVTFTVLVENSGPVALTLTDLTDSVFGDLTTADATTCALPQTLAANGGSYSCTFQGTITGDENAPHKNTVTATGKDKDEHEVKDTDDETVTFDQLPQIEVSKRADKTQIVEPNELVNFTIVVSNTGLVSVTLTELTDSDFGSLNGQGTCAVPQTIPVGGSYSCTFAKLLEVADGNPHQNTATAVGKDKDGNTTTDDDDETVDFLPRVAVGDLVWEDVDEDGIQDPGEPGVPGVTVNLLNSNGAVISTTVTNSAGKYLFAYLVPGTYRLRVTKPEDFDFTEKGAGSDPTRDSDVDVIGETDLITLTDGKPDLTRDVGLVDTTPTGEEEEDQPSAPSKIFLPALQSASAAPDTVAAAAPQPQADATLYLPTLQGNN